MSDDELSLGGIFPEEPRPPTPEPTVEVYYRDDDIVSDEWREIKIRLVGSHPLWGHHLYRGHLDIAQRSSIFCRWNAARAFASYLDHNQELYRDRFVLELGAGGGLPGLVAARNGAQHVLLTDYPDANLVQNMEHNVTENALRGCVSVKGYVWGHPTKPLTDALSAAEDGFHLIIMSDLVFNHSQVRGTSDTDSSSMTPTKHDALLQTCENSLAGADGAAVLVFYTHHRPHLADKDMEFFSKARVRGWTCEEILTRRFAPMFPEDAGEESVRATVHGWRLKRA
ncbi:nicotinamide N-methyltransferase [Mycena maculata]|uniref:Nicotinamide N-methyltransferase n=1 Tax=Mycena maculata TaxID=230809 RepID=A0AAD7I245_9AGAR|nr:nicotinamide N-methyltransferase [Mycena maculata]